MSRTLLESQIKLGGPTKIVEIDESKWGHKRKYNRGRINKNSQWILGLIVRGTSKVCLLIVRNRSAEELIPLIQGVVLPGTTIMSDQWAAYNSLGTLGYTHYTVNHTENFVDPRTGAHTQTIESFWGQSKSIFKNMRGSTADQLPPHLDEVMFRWNNKEQPMFHLLLQKFLSSIHVKILSALVIFFLDHQLHIMGPILDSPEKNFFIWKEKRKL